MIKYNTYEAVIKEISNIQYSDLINRYIYNKTYDKECICLFEEDTYVGTISFEWLLDISDTIELEYKIKKNDFHLFLDEDGLKRIIDSKKHEEYSNITVRAKVKSFHDLDKLANNYTRIIELLESKGIKFFRLGFPEPNSNNSNEDVRISADMKCFYSKDIRWYVEPLLPHISTRTYNDLKREHELSVHNKRDYEASDNCMRDNNTAIKPRIFLVGPCVVDGNVLPSDTLYKVLQRKIDYADIVPVIVYRSSPDAIYSILNYSIRKKDIVILCEESRFLGQFRDIDVDLACFFDNQSEKRWLCTDKPLHMTEFGIANLTNMLVPIIDGVVKCSSSDEVILCKDEKLYDGLSEKKKYLDSYLNNVKCLMPKDNSLLCCVGAIVMNANPFTTGHRYLVECALKQCSFLLVFVVEEDESLVPFKDRLRLVKEGVLDLENVLVIPSGRYIISKETFISYFEKEKIIDGSINAAEDLYIFVDYVAPALQIKKRFVGTEPLDRVTDQYNDQMKEILQKSGNGGVETVVIERKTAGGRVINATDIRNRLLNDEIDIVKDNLPDSTYNYFVNNSFYLKKRHGCMERLYKLKGNSFGKMRNSSIIMDFIVHVDRCCICGNTEGVNILLKDIKMEDYTNLIIICGGDEFTLKNMESYSDGLSYIISDTKDSFMWYKRLRCKGITTNRIMIANFA